MDAAAYKGYRTLALSALAGAPVLEKCSAGALRRIIRRDLQAIGSAYKTAVRLDNGAGRMPEAFEWIADNYYAFEEKGHTVLAALGGRTRYQGTKMTVRGEGTCAVPRFYAAFFSYLGLTDRALDAAALDAFVSACEDDAEHLPEFADYYSFELLCTCAVISKTAEVCRALLAAPYAENRQETAREIGSLVASLKYVGVHRFEAGFENCATEVLLRKDPAGFYADMTVETKNYYRSRVSYLSDKAGKSESEFVSELLEKARNAEKVRMRHIGAYLYPVKKAWLGWAYFSLLAMLTIAALLPLMLYVTPWTLLLLFPIWEAAKTLCDRIFSLFVKTPPIPRLALEKIPDTDGVLVVITTLLFGGKADDEMFSRLEKMYLSTGMRGVYFAILGDYADAPTADTAEDTAILDAARDRVDALNAKYGGGFYLFLRRRSYCKTERSFMGYERKRGAVAALVRFLCGGENAFIEGEGAMPRSLCDSIRYVVTLDADTTLPIDGVRALAGAMLHPLNRPVIDAQKHRVVEGYGLMQPRVGCDLAAARRTGFSRVLCGTGGVEIYSFAQFDLYQSLFHEAVFCGKGIFDKYAFNEVINRDETAFPEETVLSHDILEGARLRTALIGDVEVTDGFPKNELSYLKRHHRWVRGDAQNLIFLKKHFVNAKGKRVKNNLSPLSKFKLFDNVRREAAAVFAFFGILAANFLPHRAAAVMTFSAIFYILLPFLFDLLTLAKTLGFQCAARRFFSKGVTGGVWQSLERALMALAMLPKNAFVTLDAFVRCAVRMTVTHKKKLEWVTAAQGDAANDGGLLYYVQKNLAGAILGAVLFIFSPFGELKLIGLIWFFFPAAAYFSARESGRQLPEADEAERAKLKTYASDMWRYFENTVGAEDNFFPIDNLQLFPTTVAAHRTSPTNIGLYLVSVLCARDFGFIDAENLYTRLDNTLTSVEKSEKWCGHLYNWYDTRDLSLLAPKYISSVDSGNFLACLIVVKEGVKRYVHEKAELAAMVPRIEKLLAAADLSAIYDSERELFSLGVSFEADGRAVMSENCYDMLMSEARTLSYIAASKRAVPKKHWSRLARPLIKKNDRVGLASWTGTAFEYFMPALFLPTVKGSLMYEALRFAFYCQRERLAHAKSGRLWGISESGYFAFDSDMNYRYKAFGVPKLGFKRGLERDLVISPYSSFLALCLNTSLPLANLGRLAAAGAYGRFGFYEAYDFTPERSTDGGALIKSYMSHHVGMSFIACANACFENITVKRFMSDGYMRSGRELLEEKIPVDAVVRRVESRRDEPERPERVSAGAETVRTEILPESPFCRVISDGFTGVLATDTGDVRLYAGKNALNAASSRKNDAKKGFFTFFAYSGGEKEGDEPLSRVESTAYLPFMRTDATYSFAYSGGSFEHRFENDKIRASSAYTVLSDSSVIAVDFRAYMKKRMYGRNTHVTTAFCFEPLMMPAQDAAAHPAFHALFVMSEYDEKHAVLVFERRPRDGGDRAKYLAVGFSRAERNFSFGTQKRALFDTPFDSSDYERILTLEPENKTGACVAPYCFVKTTLGADADGGFACRLLLAYGDDRAAAIGGIESARAADAARSREKAENLEALLLLGCGLASDGKAAELTSAVTARVLYPEPISVPEALAGAPTGKPCLWECGISGDLPLILVSVPSAKAAKRAERFIRTFVLLKKKRLAFDMAFLFRDSEKYSRPSENALLAAVESCGAAEYLKKRGGGIFLVDPSALSDGGRALYAYAAGYFDVTGELHHNSEKTSEKTVSRIVTEPTGNDSPTSLPNGAFENGNGYFTADGAYTVCKNQPLALPQSMVLSGRMLSTVVTQSSLGYTFAGNAALRRITPFQNDPTEDMAGERLLLKTESGMYDLIAMAGQVRYAPGEAVYSGEAQGLRYRVSVYVPEKLPVKVLDVSLESGGTRAGELIFAVLAAMGEREREGALCEKRVNGTRAEFCNPFSEYFSTDTGFAFCTSPACSYKFPEQGTLNGYVLCTLPLDGSEKSVRFALGAYRTGSGMGDFCEKALKTLSEEELSASAKAFAESRIPRYEIRADGRDGALRSAALMFGVWLPYQNGVCRMTARSGFYQSGGAYGYRDQLQDALALMYADADATRTHIIRAAAHQFEDGGALHWWHPKPPKTVEKIAGNEFHRGIRSNCSDDYLWLVYAVCEYIRYTGDTGLLDVPVRYAAGEELRAGESERYIQTTRSETVESLFDHCLRALGRAYERRGAKGLALLGSGDWSDGLNKAGEGLRGESVWLSMFLKCVSEMFLQLCAETGRTTGVLPLEKGAKELGQNLMKSAYDAGAGYFLRAWYDDGTPIGAPGSDECRIDLIAQAFSLFCDMPLAAGRSAMRHAYDELYDESAKIFKLLAPPFHACAKNPGYIKSYVPGIRENGGQYTHAAVWGSMAMIRAACADGEKVDAAMLREGVEALLWLMPPRRCADKERFLQYGCEPYVLCGDIYAGGELAGRGGWSWYTGSAGWLWRAVLETLFGVSVRRHADGVRLCFSESAFYAPFVPESPAELVLREKDTVCTVRYVKAGSKRITLDGKEAAGREIVAAHGEHTVCVESPGV